jgi:transglutaminase-like putative cysteine protease
LTGKIDRGKKFLKLEVRNKLEEGSHITHKKGQKACAVITLVVLVFNTFTIGGCWRRNRHFEPAPVFSVSPDGLAQILGSPQLIHRSHYYPVKECYRGELVKSIFGMELPQSSQSGLKLATGEILHPPVDMTDLASIGALIESLRSQYADVVGEWKIPLISPPTPEDLGETPDIRITPRIQALAAQLNHCPRKIFLYVRNQMDFEPYFRSLKGSEGTAIDRAGNSTDLSSLLIALLRASGIHSRYVVGIVSLPIEAVMNWVGVQDPETAYEVLVKSGIPAWEVRVAGKTFVFMVHDWVEAFISPPGVPFGIKVWVPMDPSFKEYDYFPGIDIAHASGFCLNTFLAGAKEGAIINEPESWFTGLNRAFIEEKADEYVQSLMEWVQANIPNATVGDVTGYRKIREATKITPPPLPFLPLRAVSEMAPPAFLPEVPWRYGVRFELSGIDYHSYTPELAGKRIGIYYEPVTFQAGEVKTVRPKLLVEDEVVGVGVPIPIGERHLLTMRFYDVWGSEAGIAEKHLTAGSHYVITLALQRITPKFLGERIEKLEREFAELTPGELLPIGAILEILYTLGVGWFMQLDVTAHLQAQTGGVIWTRLPSVAVTEWDALIAHQDGRHYPARKEGGMNIDVIRSAVSPFSVVGDFEDVKGWMVSTGKIGSTLEHLIFEQFFRIASVSTMRILAFASNHRIPIYHIHSGNVDEILPKLNTWFAVKHHIRDAIEKGWVVLVPQRNIEFGDWFGIGWMIVDPQTGAGGYLIAGYRILGEIISGGATNTSVEGFPDRWVQWYRKYLEKAVKLIKYGEDLKTAAELAVAGILIYIAGAKLTSTIGGAAIGVPLKVIGGVFIVGGITLGVWTIWRWLEQEQLPPP